MLGIEIKKGIDELMGLKAKEGLTALALAKAIWQDADRASAIAGAWEYAQAKARAAGWKTSQIRAGKIIRGVRLCNGQASLAGLSFDDLIKVIKDAGGKLEELSEEKAVKLANGESLKKEKTPKKEDAAGASDGEQPEVVTDDDKIKAILEIAKTLPKDARDRLAESLMDMD